MNTYQKKFITILIISLLTFFFITKALELNQIDKISNTLNKSLYNPILQLQNSYTNNKSNTEINNKLEDIKIKHPEIVDISYINNNKYVFSTHHELIGKTISKYISSFIKNNSEPVMIDGKNGYLNIVYIYKYGSGYYKISFYYDLMTKQNHQKLTKFKVYSVNNKYKKNSGFHLLLPEYKEITHLNLIVKSGITLKNSIFILLISTIISLLIFSFFVEILLPFLNEKVKLKVSIKKAIKNNEFTPYFQSVYSIKNKEFSSAEVLCRWVKNDGSIITPNKFIPLLEQTGYIKDVTLYLIEKSFIILKNSNRTSNFRLSFNFTVDMMIDDKYIDNVIELITKNNIRNNITIEITESQSRDDCFNKLKENMLKLKNHGVLMSIDDVGTGYSNFLTIQELPFDIIKIDRCFVSEKFALSKSNMIEVITLIGRSMNRTIIVEGVESDKELEKVKKLEIDLCQGFLFSKPCNGDDFISMNKSNN